ncbi:hypothetical protein [Nocardia farcinica]|uniref:hypothetical protein n=1 Tax=Nocardia farcinica TaxID=37329 RepID=UPI002454E98F|nr:hypothetical protein [Nocardia farcinica]
MLVVERAPARRSSGRPAPRPREIHKRQALARRGVSRFAPPTRAHVMAGELALRAIQLPGIRALVRRSIQRANN